MEPNTNQVSCGFCGYGEDVKNLCGTLHTAEISEDGKQQVIAAHHKCLQYSALLVQYKFDNFGGFKLEKVREELKRGKRLKCSLCKDKKNKKKTNGATAGCAYKRCSKTFHFYCAKCSPKSITKRMEIKSDGGKTVVLYRVFCGDEHLKKYSETSDLGELEAVSDSDQTGDEDDVQTPLHDSPSPCKIKSQSHSREHTLKHQTTNVAVIRTLGTVQCADNEGTSKVIKMECNQASSTHRNEQEGQSTDISDYPETAVCGDEIRTPTVNKRKSSQELITGDCLPSKRKRDAAVNYYAEDLVLCITERRDPAGSEALRAGAKSTFNLEDSIHIWQSEGLHLNRSQMLWFMVDVVDGLSAFIQSADKFDHLYCLLFCLGEDSLRRYDIGAKVLNLDNGDAELEKNIWKMQCKQVCSKLNKLQDSAGRKVGHLQKESDGTQVLYILLSDITDPRLRIRRTLQNKVYEWPIDLELKVESENLDPEYSASQEITILRKKLRQVAPSARVFSYPCDDFLRLKQASSVCGRLFRHYTKHLSEQPDSRSLVVFIGPMDTTVVVFRNYVQRCVESVLQENNGDCNDIFFALDIGADLKITQLPHITRNFDENLQLVAWTAHDPSKEYVSCAILKFYKSLHN